MSVDSFDFLVYLWLNLYLLSFVLTSVVCYCVLCFFVIMHILIMLLLICFMFTARLVWWFQLNFVFIFVVWGFDLCNCLRCRGCSVRFRFLGLFLGLVFMFALGYLVGYLFCVLFVFTNFWFVVLVCCYLVAVTGW